MAVYNWQLIQEHSGSIEMEVTEWDDVYIVLGYTQGTGPAWNDLVADRPDLAPGIAHPSITFAKSVSFTPERLGDTEAWKVSVSWEIEISGEDEEEDSESELPPTLRPAKITFDSETIEVPVFYWSEEPGEFFDDDGVEITPTYPWGAAWPAFTDAGGSRQDKKQAALLIRNTALDFMHGVTMPTAHWQIRVSKNVVAYPTWILDYANAVNSDVVFLGGLAIPAGCLMITSLNIGERQSEVVNGVRYSFFEISFTLTYNPNSWKTRLLDAGNRAYKRIGSGDGTLATDWWLSEVVDSSSSQVASDGPALLDQQGKQLFSPVTPSEVITVEGWLHPRLPYSALPLS